MFQHLHATQTWNINTDNYIQNKPDLLYLVEDVSLAAQVQVRQDAGRPHVGDRQAGLRDAGGNQSGLPLTETRKQVGELGETT